MKSLARAMLRQLTGAVMIKIQNILVPTDFSEPSDSALVYGRTLARTFNARLHVLHVVDDSAFLAGVDGYALNGRTVLADMTDEAEKQLLTCLTEEDWRDPKTITEVWTGAAAPGIVDYARQEAIDLIVMGSHGRGFISGLLTGRVAEKVVRIAPCPVLTVRTPEREFVVPDTVETTTGVLQT
jgi:nucleotide-binding universal stress UspA family protein